MSQRIPVLRFGSLLEAYSSKLPMESVLGRYRNLVILVGVLFLQVLGLAMQVKRTAPALDTGQATTPPGKVPPGKAPPKAPAGKAASGSADGAKS